MSDKYKLNGHAVERCDDLMEWARWFETADRKVAHDRIGDAEVSTFFLGLDYSFGACSPLLFETMVVGGLHNGDMARCGTWEEAEQQHKAMVARLNKEAADDHS